MSQMEDILRRLDRVESVQERMERKLDDKIVYKDVYRAEKDALREALGAAALASAERDKSLKEDVDDLKAWRKTIYVLIATAYLGLIGAILTFLLNQAGGGAL